MAAAEHPGITRFKEERDRFKILYDFSQCSEDPEVRHAGWLARLTSEARAGIVRAYEAGEPFIATNYCTAPEVAVAMDLPWFMLYEAPFLGATPEPLQESLDATAAMGLSQDLCAVHRSSIYAVEHGLVPVPTAAIGLLFPCDGLPMMHQVIRHSQSWRDVPMFSPDPPYFNDDRAVTYFANELRKMAAFLERHTGRRLELDRLKAVIEEGEKQYRLWDEYNELRRAVPCPHGYEQGGVKCFAVTQCLKVGQPEGTQWFAQLLELTERRVAQGIGPTPREKIRLFWFDLMPTSWAPEFMSWLEQEWGAVVVMDMQGDSGYSPIDTSSEEGMWLGLARRGLFETPMMRQAVGPAESRLDELVRVIKDYKIDVVVWPNHMGHKETQAVYGIIRELCRELGVPIMDIGMDVFDNRYTTADEIKDKFTNFFRAMGLG